MAIIDFEGLGISQQEAQLLTNRLRTLLVQTDNYNIIERGQMEQIFQEQNFQLSSCTSQECAVEIGQILGAQQIMTGSIGKIGETFTVDLRIIDVATSEILRTASYDIRGEIDLMLTEGMVEVARRISGESRLGAGPRYGTLNVYSEPSGARVFIDNRERGSTPFAATDLPAGEEYNVRLMLDGYQPITRTIKIREGDNPALNVSLQASYGELRILSQPAGARVYIDDRELGATPVAVSELAAGEEHTVRLALDGYREVTRTLTIQEGENPALNMTLEPMWNWVTIQSRPRKAVVLIDNEPIGKTPIEEIRYRVGLHSIELNKSGYRPYREQFEVKSQDPTLLNIRLRSKSRGTAFLLSMFIPGSGHFFRGKPLAGLFFMGASAAAGYLAFDAQMQMEDLYQEYQTRLDKYNSTTDINRLYQLEEEVWRAFDEVRSYQETRDTFLGVLGGVYSLNLITVVF